MLATPSFSLPLSLACLALFPLSVGAQIAPDGSLGAEGSVVVPAVINGLPSDQLEGGALRGANLFHSFREFSVPDGRGAYFANPAGVANIFSRVTGGNISQILGTLGVLGNANLYFLNPNGIVFGPNARLDVRGSFLATTADSFIFDNGFEFSAANPTAPPLLTVSIPIGLNFRESSTGQITNQGSLNAGQDLTLAGNNLNLQGQVVSGRSLTLAAEDTVQIRDSLESPFIAAAGGDLIIQGNRTVDIFALNHPNSGFFSLGDMTLRSSEQVGGDAHFWSGGNFRIEQLDGTLGKLYSPNDPVIRTAGDVLIGSYQGASLHIIAGGKVEITDYVFITGADPDYGLQEVITLADGTVVTIDGKNQPTLDIRAGVAPVAIGLPGIEESGFDFFGDLELSNLPSSADINVGTIIFQDFNFLPVTGYVSLTNQYQPSPLLTGNIQVSETFPGLGAITTGGLLIGGDIIISSRNNVDILGNLTTNSEFLAGNILINAVGDLTIVGNILAQSNDLSGNITLNSGGTISLINDSQLNVRSSEGGNITINTKDLTMSGGTNRIRAGIEAGLGNPEAQGGDVTINASGTVYLEGNSFISNWVNNASQGNAGNTYINADLLRANGGGATSNIDSNAQGKGGSIIITVNNLIVENDGRLGMALLGQGQLGNLQISASDSVSISDSTLGSSVGEGGIGNSGDVEVIGNSITVNNSTISASSDGNGNAGSVLINGLESVDISNNTAIASNIGNSSGITSQGSVGNIQIQGGTISISNSEIQASVYSGGTGTQPGIVNIHATNNISFENSSVFTNVDAGGFGNGGDVRITLEDGDLILNEGSISTSTPDGNSRSGDITIQANSLSMNNDSSLRSAGSIIRDEPSSAGNVSIITTDSVILDNSSDIQVSAQGRGGDVLINTNNLSLLNGSGIFGSVRGDQPGGTITINASDTIEVSGFIESFPGSLSGSSISVDTTGNGNAGDIIINTQNLLVENGGFISAAPLGDVSDPSISGEGGTITINASKSVNVQGATPDGLTQSTIAASTAGIGKGGDIQINTQQLTMSDGATIQAITTGNGQGGSIEINANSVDVIGTRPPFNVFPTSIDVTTNGSGASGNAGNIRIVTGQLSVRDGAEINASTSNFGQGGNIDIIATESVNISGTYPTVPIESQLVSQTFGSGQGGTIYIESPILILDNRGRISSQTSSSGNAGNVIVNAPNSIALGDNSQITVQTVNLGNPGDIAITTDALSIGANAQLSATITPTSTNTTGGGSITLNASNLDISGQLGIFAETQGEAPAGSLTINPNDNNPDLNIRFT
ncbi:MAG: filamentous hemagglutinin N-terminal domain-containing protein, partial [Cyanobacteria bacterium RI_101]|nr:filamentous hemagglutinin N-terminal domain-containing protein [Cyanobacteria bacterium RI_101]